MIGRSGRFPSILVLLLCIVTYGCNNKIDDPMDDDSWSVVMYDGIPGWSPDGTTIAFERTDDPTKDIQGGMFLYELTSGLVSPVFSESNTLGQPDYSPDGNWLACANQYIFKVTPDGDSMQQLTFSDDGFFPDWSPDGASIAYDISAGPNRGIYILDVETGESRLIYRYARHPMWFPDGSRLLTSSYNFGSYAQLAIIDTSGALIQQLTDSGIHESGHDVSPDGSIICFGRQGEEEPPQLWTMTIEGNQPRRLTTDGGLFPAFSPDGALIVFTYSGSGNGCLWLMQPDGSNKRQITFWGKGR